MPRTKQVEAAPVAEPFEPDAYVIRTCGKDGESPNGFRWPMTVGALVECPDWSPEPKCGNGLHGLLDGIGDWSLIDSGHDRVWQVVGVKRAEVVVIDDAKVKFQRGVVIYLGNIAGAMALIQPEAVKRIQAETKNNIATGHSGHAAATGYSGHAAATGKQAIAVSLGICGSAMAGPDGWIVLAAWEETDDGLRITAVKAAKVGGPEGIKPNVTYRLNEAGEFVSD